MSYESTNSRKIIEGFATAQRLMNEAIVVGFTELLEAGVRYCLEEHDAMHQRHLETGDSYGWVLLYNGSEISRSIYAKGMKAEGNASRALDTVKSKCPSEGWAGVVLAGVEPATYFNVRYEFIPMRAGIKDLKAEDFDRIFKPMVA